MYRDPAKIRKHTIKVRLNDREYQLLSALVNLTGDQLAAVVRDLALEHAETVLLDDQCKCA